MPYSLSSVFSSSTAPGVPLPRLHLRLPGVRPYCSFFTGLCGLGEAPANREHGGRRPMPRPTTTPIRRRSTGPARRGSATGSPPTRRDVSMTSGSWTGIFFLQAEHLGLLRLNRLIPPLSPVLFAERAVVVIPAAPGAGLALALPELLDRGRLPRLE